MNIDGATLRQMLIFAWIIIMFTNKLKIIL